MARSGTGRLSQMFKWLQSERKDIFKKTISSPLIHPPLLSRFSQGLCWCGSSFSHTHNRFTCTHNANFRHTQTHINGKCIYSFQQHFTCSHEKTFDALGFSSALCWQSGECSNLKVLLGHYRDVHSFWKGGGGKYSKWGSINSSYSFMKKNAIKI